MNAERAINKILEHMVHWERLVHERICTEKEGTENIEAFEKAVEALKAQPCEDAVSRQEALNTIPKVIGGQNDFADCIRDSVEAVINACPSVQPKAKTGKWEYGYSFPDGEYCKCSKCKEIIKCIYPMHYCPNCGNPKEVTK